MDDGSVNVLPFDSMGQKAVIGHALTNEQFYHRAIIHVKGDWFLSPDVGKLWNFIAILHRRYGRQPTESELRNTIRLKAPPHDANKLEAIIIQCVDASKQIRIEYIRSEATEWLKTRYYHRLVSKSADHFNASKFKEAYAEVSSTLKELESATFEAPIGVDVSNLQALLHKQTLQYHNALTFGTKLVDQRLLELDNYTDVEGSLLPGDTTVLLAPINVGKSVTMITIAAENIRRHKHVIYLTHEGAETDIVTKIWCSLVGTTRQGLWDLLSKDGKFNHDGVEKPASEVLEWAVNLIKTYLVYIPLVKAPNYIEDVIGVIRDQNETLKNKIGKGFDLLVDDYPANLTTMQAQKGMARRERDDTVYGYIVDLAGELKMHALCAIQANREGSKLNRWGAEDGSRLLGMEDVSESFGPMMRATNVISINRDDMAASRNRITFHICKSRSSQTGWAVVCKSNFDYYRSHHPVYGGIYFRSTQSMSERVDTFLDQYAGSDDPQVPPERLMMVDAKDDD